MEGFRRGFLRTAIAVLDITYFCALFFAQSAKAYTFTLSSDGLPIRWEIPSDAEDKIHFSLAGNTHNQSGIDALSLYLAVTKGLQRWTEASQGKIQFDYWQGDEDSIYVPNSVHNGKPSIYFASHASAGNIATPQANVIGLTQVWYQIESGKILETDIMLNDVNFQFSLNPKDTTGQGSGNSSGNKVFLDSVLTHELGHAFGMAHSNTMQSSMLFQEAPDQAHLSCDDTIGIRSLYDIASGTGKISGRVLQSNGSPVFGAAVAVISINRGVVLASALTDKNGNYDIRSLENGRYAVYVEPFSGGAQALPVYYSGLQAKVCESQNFPRSFYKNENKLTIFSINSGQSVTSGDLILDCSGNASVKNLSVVGGSSLAQAASVDTQTGVIDRMIYSSGQYYRVNNISGALRVSALAHSLYSPLKTNLELYNSSFQLIAKQATPIYSSETGYQNFDGRVEAEGLPQGDYYIKVITQSLPQNYFPAGGTAVDSVPFIVLTVSTTPKSVDGGSLPDSAKCRTAEDYPKYISPPGGPYNLEKDDANYGLWGFCGTVALMNSGGSGGGSPAPPMSANVIFSWFFPWILMLIGHGLLRGSFKGRLKVEFLTSYR